MGFLRTEPQISIHIPVKSTPNSTRKPRSSSAIVDAIESSAEKQLIVIGK